MVGPVIVVLFGNKLQILEQLVIYIDSYELYHGFDMNGVPNINLHNNIDLFYRKAADPNPYNYEVSMTEPEEKRIEMHTILRRVIYELGNGNFFFEMFEFFNYKLRDIKYKTFRYPESIKG